MAQKTNTTARDILKCVHCGRMKHPSEKNWRELGDKTVALIENSPHAFNVITSKCNLPQCLAKRAKKNE